MKKSFLFSLILSCFVLCVAGFPSTHAEAMQTASYVTINGTCTSYTTQAGGSYSLQGEYQIVVTDSVGYHKQFYSQGSLPSGSDTFSPALASGTVVSATLYVYTADETWQQLATNSYSCSGSTVTVVNSDCPFGYPILSQVFIPAKVLARSGPRGDSARRIDKSEIYLPLDANHDGKDTYLVIATKSISGQLWLGLYIGGCVPVWIESSQAVLLRPLP